MKKQIARVLFGLTAILFIGCEREESHDHGNEGRLVFEKVDLGDIPLFEAKFNSDGEAYKAKISNNKSGNTINYFDLIVPEGINSELYDQENNLHYYTFALSIKEENQLTNLVVKETLEGNKYYVFVFKSKSIEAWLQSLAYYSPGATVDIPTEVFELQLEDTYSEKSKRSCWTGVTKWTCPYNQHTIGEGDWLECNTFKAGGDGLARWKSSITYMEIPCDNGDGGTGGSGTGSGSGSSGGSGGDSGGSNGGGGSGSGSGTTVVVQPNAPSQLSLFVSSLTSEQKAWWNNLANATKKIPFMSHLTQNNHSEESEDFVRWAIDYLIANPSVTIAQFKNWFMPQKVDTEDTSSLDLSSLNLSFPPQSLPSFDDFLLAYPSTLDSNFDTPQKIYTTVGGAVLTKYNQGARNTCALRISRAFNNCNINIPNISGVTVKGADNKNYFLVAKNLLSWMKKTFGTPTGSNHLTGNQGNINGEDFINYLKGKEGIYIMIPNDPSLSGFNASGHADLFFSDICDNNCYFNATGGVKEIFFWELP